MSLRNNIDPFEPRQWADIACKVLNYGNGAFSIESNQAPTAFIMPPIICPLFTTAPKGPKRKKIINRKVALVTNVTTCFIAHFMIY